ncbi:conserved exported hypothetical protein [uncultured delta proteobacterium]|uniref:Uncharacterized protein n=1 Tax=uncultured delta proteobacterium TaxID=34034 RepID=A0A212J707_9DELT|nr:conserved exported hypothetical protein [uncultured delta proteobacterium]
MKTNTTLPYALSFLFLLVCLTVTPGTGVCPAHAADAAPAAKKTPEAKKPPVAKAQPKAKPKVAPRQTPAALTNIEASAPKKVAPAAPTKSQTAAAPAQQQTAVDDKLKNSLDVFAKDCITRMNKQRRPGITDKEVKRQPDGSFMARYMAVDPDSLVTSYNPTDNNKTIKYIGRMNYHEVEYVCTGKDQKQALAGPFNESNRTPITELIKYKGGKWTY